MHWVNLSVRNTATRDKPGAKGLPGLPVEVSVDILTLEKVDDRREDSLKWGNPTTDLHIAKPGFTLAVTANQSRAHTDPACL